MLDDTVAVVLVLAVVVRAGETLSVATGGAAAGLASCGVVVPTGVAVAVGTGDCDGRPVDPGFYVVGCGVGRVSVGVGIHGATKPPIPQTPKRTFRPRPFPFPRRRSWSGRTRRLYLGSDQLERQYPTSISWGPWTATTTPSV